MVVSKKGSKMINVCSSESIENTGDVYKRQEQSWAVCVCVYVS